MKDSGVEWIGEIPDNWKKQWLKKLYSFQKGKNAARYTSEYIGLNKGEYPVFSGQTENNGVMGYIDSYEYDLDVCLFTTTVGAKVMTPKILNGKFTLSQNCLIMMPNHECENRFYFYALGALFDYEKSLIPSYMQPSLRMEDLKRYFFYIPEIPEQTRIADFLDCKVDEIDKLVKEVKEIIDEYKRYKQSLITKAVSRGLQEVKLKETENIHIPEIPDTWDMKKLKYVFYIKKDIAGETGYDVLSITQKGIKVKDITSNAGQLAADYSNYQRVNIGDFAMNHMDLLTGWVDVSKYNGVTSPDYRVFNFISEKGYSRRYYLYLMQMCYMNRIFYGLGQGVSNLGRWRLQADKFLNFTIPVPPIEEQEEIAQYLDVKCGETDKIITQKEALVSELESYKKSLIYEYVTGKKEVPVENVR